MTVDSTQLKSALEAVREELLAERQRGGYWEGQLASSALSTATAVSALSVVRQRWIANATWTEADDARVTRLICAGLEWLADRQCDDGGWGDTDASRSNIATTMLVMAAFQLNGVPADHQDLMARAQAYVDRQGGIRGLRRRYGRDRTFAVPILTNCALAGMVPWSAVKPLPFEFACLPQRWYRFLRLPVVSYAIPALVAVGQARFHHQPPRNPLMRLVRRLAAPGSLEVLRRMQPDSGGFLEAVPLTSFVVMSLAGSGKASDPAVSRGVDFLIRSVRPDGSWPIDTNLATWNTTLAIQALCADERTAPDEFASLDWLLECQHQEVHPFTGAEPGGWGWTDLSGGVPDADDTSGALIALRRWYDLPDLAPDKARRIEVAARRGLVWLLRLQNRDGGWPTFCRGWGTLPFDRSGSDLTAHALRALAAWPRLLAEQTLRAAVARGFQYLAQAQRPDGSWVPLWFGNQWRVDEANPVYGTARVLLAFRDVGRLRAPEAQRGLAWLRENQLRDGSWGPPPESRRHNPSAGRERSRLAAARRPDVEGPETGSVEETALAVEALLADWQNGPNREVALRGLTWLVRAVHQGRHREPSPIGLYFAKLWYHERLYPLTFAASALAQACAVADLAQTPAPRPARMST